MKFDKLGLSKTLLAELDKAGFENPTEIQEKTIPLALAGKDIIGGSATGSGKTLAFGLPMIEKLTKDKHIQALILTPTRELAEQVAQAISKFSKNKRLNVTAVYGGVDINAQMRRIAVSDIVVATPGRMLDHLERRTIRVDQIKFLVLDEVDRMFDMGFHTDVERIIQHCSKKRQTMLFSATISSDIDYLAKKHTKDAVEVAVKSYVDHSKLKQIYYDVPSNLKFSLLVHLLQEEKSKLVMVFCATRRNVDFIVEHLQDLRIHAQAIHGGLAQNKRTKVLELFHGTGANILVCTDVAARGLDIKGVSHVYNYDLPKSSNDYIHRIGRTARAGNEGKAISILTSRDYENFGVVTQDKSLKIENEPLPLIKKIMIRMAQRSNSRDSRGRGSYNSRGPSRGPRTHSRDSRGPSRGPRTHSRDSRGPSRGPRTHSRDSKGPRTHSRDSRGPSRGSRGGSNSYSSKGPKKPGRGSYNSKGPRTYNKDSRKPKRRR